MNLKKNNQGSVLYNLTAKDEAQKIVSKYEKIQMLKDFGGMDKELAKECGILETEARINELKLKENVEIYRSKFHHLDRIIYLDIVKNFIKKL